MYRDFTDQQLDAFVAQHGNDHYNALVQREVATWWDGESPYDPQEYNWRETPPDDGQCQACYRWRRYGPGQRHFGYAYWRVCVDCDHEHHKQEIWMA